MLVIAVLAASVSGVEIRIDAQAGRRPVSPYLYGRNNSLSDDPRKPLSEANWQFLRDAGVRILRENGGNNATKYNWTLKLSSHPDWYNNVYNHDWDYAVQSLQKNLHGVQGMWAFQLIGKAASNANHNFGDWDYNRSQWWAGVAQNLAGGGVPNPAGGGKALIEGNPALYLTSWSPKDTASILDHWFDPNGLAIDPNGCLYWNMDNEPEIWSGTHDDVYPKQPSAETFVQLYFAVAKEARARFPRVRLAGPVACNEWQWYNWNGDRIEGTDGRYYCWLEYFIKRIAEEQKASGIRLLDVLDVHFYPGETTSSDIVQLHRIWFDTTYNYPGTNGVKRLGISGWDNALAQEYIFGRCRQWLDTYLGPNHGVGLGVSEIGIQGSNPNVTAVWYASTLGVFVDEGVELFTPWSWKVGMWEVLHLFSRYQQSVRVQATSDQETEVSAYASVNANADDMTVILVNRSLDCSNETQITLANFPLATHTAATLTLSSLPAVETFRSHENNALQKGSVPVVDGRMSLTLAPLSVTAILLADEPNDAPL